MHIFFERKKSSFEWVIHFWMDEVVAVFWQPQVHYYYFFFVYSTKKSIWKGVGGLTNYVAALDQMGV